LIAYLDIPPEILILGINMPQGKTNANDITPWLAIKVGYEP
jgi:hypothetical protein